MTPPVPAKTRRSPWGSNSTTQADCPVSSDTGAGDTGADQTGADQTVSILAWTTTPWTLPSNLALAVGPDLQYAVMRDADGSRYVLSEAAVQSYERQLRDATHVGTISGSELVGRTYVPLFSFFADMAEVDPEKSHHGKNRAFVVLEGDFIDTSEGTGVVHMAPGFGEDDQRVAAAAGIGTVVPVDDSGCFHRRSHRLGGHQRA